MYAGIASSLVARSDPNRHLTSGVGLITTLLALMSAAWILMTLEVAFVVRPLPHACPTPPCARPAATPPTPPPPQPPPHSQATCGVSWSIYVIVRQVRRPPHALRPSVPAPMTPSPEPEPRARARARAHPSPSSVSPSAPSANPSAPHRQARRIHAKFGLSKKDIVSFEDMIAVGDRMYDKHYAPCRRLPIGPSCEGAEGQGLRHRSPRCRPRR